MQVEYVQRDGFIESVITGDYDQEKVVPAFRELFAILRTGGIDKVVIDTQQMGGRRSSTGGIVFGLTFVDLYDEYVTGSGNALRIAFLRDEKNNLPFSPEYELYEEPGIDVGVFMNRDEAVDWITA